MRGVDMIEVGKHLRAVRLAIFLALIAALTWQSVLTQTHRHYTTRTTSTLAMPAAQAIPQQRDDQPPSPLPDNCSACRQMAQAGQFVLPSVPTVDAPGPAPIWYVQSTTVDPGPATRSHAWRSRAPPTPLQD
jgi:hypothetical protein